MIFAVGQWVMYKGKRRRAYFKDGGYCYVQSGMGQVMRVEKTRILLQFENMGYARCWVPIKEVL